MTDEEMAEEWWNNWSVKDWNDLQKAKELFIQAFLAGLKAGRQEEKLTKAKEHINKLLCLLDDFAEDEIDSGGRDFMEQARQFIKEMENE